MARCGPLNKLKLIGIKGGQNGKKPIFFLQNVRVREEKRRCRERSYDLSLRSTELRWSSCVGPRIKVRVLIEGNAWTPKPGVFIGDLSGKFRRPWVLSFRGLRKASSSLQEVGNLPTRVYFPFRSWFGLN